jgi:hypothetical protein
MKGRIMAADEKIFDAERRCQELFAEMVSRGYVVAPPPREWVYATGTPLEMAMLPAASKLTRPPTEPMPANPVKLPRKTKISLGPQT